MLKKIFLSVIVICFFSTPQFLFAEDQDCSSKVCFDKFTKIGNFTVPLIGSKHFRYYIWNAYSIALYAPLEFKSIESIKKDIPKKLVLEYHRDFSAEDFGNAAEKILKDNPDVDIGRIQSGIDQINKLYQAIKKGDRYSLEYEPGKGTSLYLNDKLLGTVPGAAFARDYFGIWLSEYPISEDMRDALLGIDS